MQKLSTALKIIDYINALVGKSISYLALVIVAIQVYEVIARYIFKSPTIWTWELSSMLFGVLFILGAAWTMQLDKHVKTDVVSQIFTERQLAIFNCILIPLLFFVFVGVMSKAMTKAAILSIQRLETSFHAWGPPLYHFKTIIAIGFILLLLQGVAYWIRNLVFVIRGIKI